MNSKNHSFVNGFRLGAVRGVAVGLTSGHILEIENIRGNQVVDTWALTQADVLEYSSMDHTRSVNSNLFYQTGMTVVSNHRRPLFTLIADSTPGWHDTLLCPCNAAIYRELGCRDYHRSCTDNFHEALAAQGLSLPFTPASLNLFMNVPVAGDTLQLRAECDIWLVLSACPQDITPINGAARQPSDIGLRWGVDAAGREGTA
ncbi:aminomethyltransferase [Sodalis sp. TME1]|nr:aminomethyltransferase [Sodalis sp. TME1]